MNSKLTSRNVSEWKIRWYGKYCKALGMSSKTQLFNWVKLHRKNPELLKTDGRHLGNKDGIKKGRPKKINLDELDKDEQIRLLKMEIDVLKKASKSDEIYDHLRS